MGRYLFARESPAAVVATMAHPRTRLVTMTVTAAAYSDLGDRGALKLIVDALAIRRRSGLEPFTVLSCDNLPDNGAVTRAAVCSLAGRDDPALAEWIAAHGAFPSSMVDRITPQTSDEDRDQLAAELGLRDRWPVMTEPFSQWIVEDDFRSGRPPIEQVGAQFVGDVRPYSLMKTRMLNGAHCAIGHVGTLAGQARIDEAVADPVLATYLERMLAEEVAPLLDPVPGIDLDDYRRTLMGRFANPGIADPLARLCRNGSSKVPAHLVQSIREARERGLAHPGLTLAVASWLRYLRSHDIDDPHADRLRELSHDPRSLLAQRSLFGPLARDGAFAAEIEACLGAIDRLGARGAAAQVAAGAESLAA
jgi:fructuronate reductase/mannitol 2-dehydrogenase